MAQACEGGVQVETGQALATNDSILPRPIAPPVTDRVREFVRLDVHQHACGRHLTLFLESGSHTLRAMRSTHSVHIHLGRFLS